TGDPEVVPGLRRRADANRGRRHADEVTRQHEDGDVAGGIHAPRRDDGADGGLAPGQVVAAELDVDVAGRHVALEDAAALVSLRDTATRGEDEVVRDEGAAACQVVDAHDAHDHVARGGSLELQQWELARRRGDGSTLPGARATKRGGDGQRQRT